MIARLRAQKTALAAAHAREEERSPSAPTPGLRGLSKGTEFDRVTSLTLLSVAQVARLLCCGRTKAYELVASGELPVVRIGRSVRVPAVALEAWIAIRTEPVR